MPLNGTCKGSMSSLELKHSKKFLPRRSIHRGNSKNSFLLCLWSLKHTS